MVYHNFAGVKVNDYGLRYKLGKKLKIWECNWDEF